MISPPDPSELFRSLREANPDEEFWAGFWPSVRSGIREAQFRTPPSRMRARAILLGSSAGLMAAAAVLAMAFLVLPAPPLPGPSARGTPPSIRTEVESDTCPPPILEDLKSASARIYTFHVGGSSDSTDVILIVDESLDI